MPTVMSAATVRRLPMVEDRGAPPRPAAADEEGAAEPAICAVPRSLREAEVAPELWNDWRWQLQHRITSLAELERYVNLTPDERAGMAAAPHLFRVGIT